MWEHLAILLIGFWLGVALFLYVSCYWFQEIFDIPSRNASPSREIKRHKYPETNTGASGAHAQLKRLVSRVVEEAASLPALSRYATEPTHMPSIESSTYEDLLATAILNKVIERYQTESGSGGRSSGIHSASASPTPSERSSPQSLRSHVREVTTPVREGEDVSDWEEGDAADESVELPRRVPFPEYGVDIVHQDDNEYRDFDEVSGSDIQAADGSWEENWLFQKKKIKTIQSVPVPMLVPNSNTDYRVLIGDRDVDDTTDLSDNASDSEENAEYKSDMKRVVESKHVIGGKIKVEEIVDFEPDSLTILNDFHENLNEENKDYVDAVNKEINDNAPFLNKEKTENITKENGKESILILGINSGPLPKAEFALKEKIHRTIFNGENENLENQNTKKDGDICKHITEDLPAKKGLTNTLSRHERVGEYEETVTMPVQRYADSLRRKHFEDVPQEIPTRDTDIVDDLIPGSIAYRERKKWLNFVEMPNNPYSPEAIQKRLLAKSTSSLFDSITNTSKESDDDKMSSRDKFDRDSLEPEDIPVREFNKHITVNKNNKINGTRSKSPSPKILQDILAEEVPQYKRYGRDYYIKEAKTSTGGRKKNSFSDTSSLSSMNKSTSIDNFDTDFASPVSASSSFSDLEAAALHQNIVRAVLSPRNASPNFAINPIFENPDRQKNADENHATDVNNANKYTNVRQQSRAVCDDGDGYVENEDIVRLKIPNKPEITEDLFETYNKVRRSNTMRSDDLCVRSKRQSGFNYTYGGSLRLSKSFHSDLW